MKSIILLSLLCLIAFQSCEQERLSDITYIRHKGVDMPVVVQGNINSGVFILYLHGGPGGTTFLDIHNKFFAATEAEYAMVYFDQRGSGNSQGKSDESLFTLAQFVEDVDVILQYIEHAYSPTHIFLLGHSWGGTLGSAYLLEGENQSKIAGWIEVDGGHNLGQHAYELSRDFLLERVSEKLEDSTLSKKEQKDWEALAAYYDHIENWREPKVIIQHSKNLNKVDGYFYKPENREGLVSLKRILFSETNFLALLAQNKNAIEEMDIWHLDLTSRLHKIQIPTLLLWGRYDGILPVDLAEEARNAMQLPDENFYIFEESSHSPHYEQTDLFNEKLLSFIQQNL